MDIISTLAPSSPPPQGGAIIDIPQLIFGCLTDPCHNAILLNWYNTAYVSCGIDRHYGMGKSTVLKIFQKLGALTYDADKIVEALLQETEVLQKSEIFSVTEIFQANAGWITESCLHNLSDNASTFSRRHPPSSCIREDTPPS